MHQLSKQTKELRKLILKQFILRFIVYTAVMLTAIALFEIYLSPAIGNLIADSTSQWQYASLSDLDQIFDGSHRMIQQDNASTGDESDTEIIRYRFLDTYASLKTFKDYARPIVFILGIAGLIFLSLNKFIIYFNELSRSVASLFEDRSAPIKLNKDLAIVQNELSAIQAESLHNELLAKQEEKRKNELIAYIAHDIRTPLTSIMGYVSLLQNNKNLSVKRREQYTAIIHAQSQKLSSMLDDFFDIARFNLQEITIKAQSIDLYTLCLQIAEDLYPAASNKELEIVVDAPLNSLCECDPKQIARALSNIVRNAIVYASPKTIITIQVKTTDTEAIISVKNIGQTISPENIETIFERFFREDQARNAEQGGAGLGLTIAREIIRAHNGTIKASSQSSFTEFVISLPRRA